MKIWNMIMIIPSQAPTLSKIQNFPKYQYALMSNRGEEKRNPWKWSKSAVLPVEKDSKTYVKMEKVKKNEAMEEFTNGFGKFRVKKEKKNLDHFSIYACHPCAGAMLIFSVSFQFYRMSPKGQALYSRSCL